MLASGQGAVQEAFTNWKALYNTSMVLTYGEHARPCICERKRMTDWVGSFFLCICLEDVPIPGGVDRWKPAFAAYPWRRRFISDHLSEAHLTPLPVSYPAARMGSEGVL